MNIEIEINKQTSLPYIKAYNIQITIVYNLSLKRVKSCVRVLWFNNKLMEWKRFVSNCY